MADATASNTESTAPAKPGTVNPARPRRRSDVPPRAQTVARRTRIVQLAIFAIAAIITIDAVVGEKGLLQTFRAQRESSQLVASIHRLRYDNARMRERARRLREDPAAIEEAARREHGLVKPGEVLVIVRDAEKR